MKELVAAVCKVSNFHSKQHRERKIYWVYCHKL